MHFSEITPLISASQGLPSQATHWSSRHAQQIPRLSPFWRFLIVILGLGSLLSGCSSVSYKVGLADCAPVYGNWCGENYPTTGSNPRAVDAWDRACRTHDKCYDAGTNKKVCDNEFIAELESLSYERLAPQRMHNAHSVFRKDGYVGGWVQFVDEIWAMTASCDGGDGKRAEFYCALNAFNGCPLNPTHGGGRAGMPCHCGGYPGVIVEQ